ncbi:MAG: hypothetical protein EAZ30_13010 [Betaproteobacteria bacterium]|nr:MAG: hypothetical protein EAZ30_13010 [Betaproteobacteria bacterium]
MKNRSIARKFAAVALAAACLGGSVSASADTPATGFIPLLPPIIDPSIFFAKPTQYTCGLATGGSPALYVSRDIQLNSYEAWSVDATTMRYWAPSAGAYSFRIVIRDTDRYGDIITRSAVKTITLAAATPLNVTTRFGNAWTGDTTRLSISHEEVTGPSALHFVQSPVVCGNAALSEIGGAMPGPAIDIGLIVTGDTNKTDTEVVEYNIPSINKYFITGRTDEKALLDAQPTVFVRTGKKFTVPAKNTYGNVYDVYRFFSPAPGAQSHVFVDKVDRDWLLSIPGTGLVDEGADFGTIKPDNAGVCPTYARKKIYRSFHSTPVVGQRNHRYSTTLADHNAMLLQGWLDEKVVFCAYN